MNAAAAVTVVAAPGTPAGQDVRWPVYHAEILDHLRLPHRVVRAFDDVPFDATEVLVLPDRLVLDEIKRRELKDWVERGGMLLCVGEGCAGEAFGITAGAAVPSGRVVVDGAPGWVDSIDVPLPCRGGYRLVLADASGDTHVAARWEDDHAPAIVVRAAGEGVAVVVGVDLWQTIVRIQQGYPVHADGVPAADGSAPVDDGVLKCDDGIVLSYEDDRALPTRSVHRQSGRDGLDVVPIFHRAYADLWRQVFVQLVLEAARRAGTPLAWLHYWPAGVPAVAHLSVDSDRNDDDDARTTLDLFDELDVESTWCHVYPGGYDPSTVARIGAQGHEHALHFNAVGDADVASWGWPELRAQYTWAQAMTGTEQIVSNKNHYTRWEGWDEFYRWCTRLGIELDESRGPSKRGNVGFPFGTCHLSRPMSTVDRLDVLMLPLHAQDLAWTTHEAVRDVILDEVVAHHGVAHFLFHPVHLHRRDYVRDACRDLVKEVRRRGLPWWTAARVNRWERLRRTVGLRLHRHGPGDAELVVESPVAISGLAVLICPPSEPRVQIDGDEQQCTVVERHGRKMYELAVDAVAGVTTVNLTWSSPEGDQ
ncbi:hypothetical protein [Phytoactinopolyspora limicola]|uniref:hypothetical protein n=1 Tax=Phytoactinopolyspora limicola TaxID=2715536 RepID=UPI0014073A30|nr:hypothetical protein [Phytoactinopolyspora limicola]